jgi:hypothetical protein
LYQSCSLENTSCDQFLNFTHDNGVPQSCLTSFRVFLQVTQDHLDVGIGNDGLDFRVGHSVSSALIVSFSRVSRGLVDQERSLLAAILAFFGGGINVETLIECLHSFVILLGHLMTSALASPGANKFRIDINGPLSVLDSGMRIHKLEVAGAPVAVKSFILGVAANSFIKLLDGGGE